MDDLIARERESEITKLEEDLSKMELHLHRATEMQQSSSRCNVSSSTSSWSDSYQQWECYEDTDDLKSKIELLKQRLSDLRERSKKQNFIDSGKSCSHRHQCGCLGNKQAERKVVAMSTSERLKHMHSFKEEGNTLFKANKYQGALALYEKSLIYFEYCFDGTVDECENADHLRLQCLLNAAACFLQLKMYRQCVEYCDDALEIDRCNTKAWFRRARAHRLLDKFDLAEKDLLKAVELNSGKKCCHIREELELLHGSQVSYEKDYAGFAQRALVGKKDT